MDVSRDVWTFRSIDDSHIDVSPDGREAKRLCGESPMGRNVHTSGKASMGRTVLTPLLTAAITHWLFTEIHMTTSYYAEQWDGSENTWWELGDMTSRADVNHSSLVIQAGGAAAAAADVTAESWRMIDAISRNVIARRCSSRALTDRFKTSRYWVYRPPAASYTPSLLPLQTFGIIHTCPAL